VRLSFQKTTIIWILVICNMITLSILAIHLHKPIKKSEFTFLDPTIANMDIDQFLEIQSSLNVKYSPLKDSINKIFAEYGTNKSAFYFEDLRTGAWVGIKEKEAFMSGSLLKVPTMAAIMRDVEDGRLKLSDKVTIIKEDIDPRFSVMYKDGYGYDITIRELIGILANHSDNTADLALRRQLEFGSYADAMFGLGLPYKNMYNNTQGNSASISPKDFSNIFRSLYYSSYLKRPSSEFILMLLSDTVFKKGVAAGLPKGVRYSTKIGIWEDFVHECGIVYTKNPYLFCVMTDGVSTERALAMIRDVSHETYWYVDTFDLK